MSGPQRRFDPAELHVPGEPDQSIAELADALAAARELEALASDTGIRPTDGFEDRVMAAIAAEPAPRLVAKPARGVRAGRLGAFLVIVRESWAVAFSGGRPMAVRAQALGFVLLVVLAAGALTGVTAVTVGALLGPDGVTTAPDRSSNPTAPTAPATSQAPQTPVAPGPSTEPTETAEPTATPEPSDTLEPGETLEPGDTTEPNETTESGQAAQPIEIQRETRTPRPTETPGPGETPRPTETPSGTDDHGSDGGGSNGGFGGGGAG